MKIILQSDFNLPVEEENISDFMSVYNLKQKTCCENPESPSFIDLTPNNLPRSFQISNVFEMGLPHFYKLISTVLKQYFPKLKLKAVNYRGYRKFRNDELGPNLTTTH